MIGIMILGHAQFAHEMVRVIEQVESPQRNLTCADYQKGDTKEGFAEAVNRAAELFEPDTSGVLIFTDSARGTPYHTALNFAEACSKYPVIVVTGANLPAIVESALSRTYINDVEMLADLAVEHGKKQVMRFGGAQPIPR